MNGVFDIESLIARIRADTSALEFAEDRPDAAVAIILDPRRDGGSLLLIKRTERDGDPWSGQIAFPGGRRSAKDRSYLDTVIREASEEVGISLGEHEVVGVLPPLYSRTKRVLVAPFVFLLRSHVSVHLNEEAAVSFWVPLQRLSAMNPTNREVTDLGRQLNAPAYTYHEHVIWGLTFRIINTLLNRDLPDL